MAGAARTNGWSVARAAATLLGLATGPTVAAEETDRSLSVLVLDQEGTPWEGVPIRGHRESDGLCGTMTAFLLRYQPGLWYGRTDADGRVELPVRVGATREAAEAAGRLCGLVRADTGGVSIFEVPLDPALVRAVVPPEGIR